MLILAADPGVNGALAGFDTDSRRLVVTEMPTYDRQISGRANLRRTLDEDKVVDLILTWHTLGATHFIIERVGGMPGQSAPNAFTFGYGCGVLTTAARCAGMIIERVEPARWKSILRVPSDKNQARARASELFPNHGHMWPLKKHDGLAEAALLALYGKVVFGELEAVK